MNTILPTLTKENVMVEWVDLGEGISGDYDETDPDDKVLLRFDFSIRDSIGSDWQEVPDSSYCTNVELNTPPNILATGLKLLMEVAYDDIAEHGRAKRILEELSWMDADWITKTEASNCITPPRFATA